ncbi:MAG: 2,3-bisphosphoglycerate-independent phosphoglycerate mutase [Chloroflexota bacterium]
MTLTLVILDGFVLNDDPARNALLAAAMPNWERITATWPTARLDAAGEAVGLPAGQMGNSEVGHLNLGAGFRVLQDLPRINQAIADGSFRENAALRAGCRAAVERGTRVHLLGLVGPGGVHAIDEHIVATAALAAEHGLPADRVLLHAFTDGRDTAPRSAAAFLPALLARLEATGTLATVGGRYYAMDRDARWERTARAYEAIVHAMGERAPSGPAAIAAAYERGETDEFIAPTVIGAYSGMGDGDIAIHLDFRADRARQLTHALADPDFSTFDRGAHPRELMVVTLTEYQAPDELPVTVAFGPLVIGSLPALLARLGKRQLHIAETEKYAHVTYFFNGGVEDELPGEDRILIPSNREVPTYDLAPEMRAEPITDAIVSAIESRAYDFIVANYANPDMVGHTGVWDAAVRAAEVVDVCLGRLESAALAADAPLVITADHGNIEEMRDVDGKPQTKHTTSPVPLVIVDRRHAGAMLRDGALSDVAPTLCELLGIDPGPEMTGTILLGGG